MLLYQPSIYKWTPETKLWFYIFSSVEQEKKCYSGIQNNHSLKTLIACLSHFTAGKSKKKDSSFTLL